MSEFENLLDEMHPCCIKEQQNEKRKSEIKKVTACSLEYNTASKPFEIRNMYLQELRGTDRSFLRIDEIRRTFTDVRARAGGADLLCGCCDASGDYPLLSRLRSAVSTTENDATSYDEQTEKSESDDEDDFDLDLDDGGIMEEMRRGLAVQVEEASRLRQEAIALGFAQHRDDSEQHLIGKL